MSQTSETQPDVVEPMWPWFRHLPWCLVATRVLLAPVAVWIAWQDLPRWLWLLQGAIAALSDIYDGKLARRWGVVTPGLRQADSIADTIYALGVVGSFWLAEPQILLDHLWIIGIIVGLEAARYPLDWALFGRGASYHANSARAFGILLIPATFMVMGFGTAWPFLWIALAVGLYSEFEGIAISLVLPRWTHDVKSLRVALEIRRKHLEDPDRDPPPPRLSLLARYRAMPEKTRMVATAIIGAAIGLLTYEVIYLVMPYEPRATFSWTVAYTIGVARQHGLHRWLTFSERKSPYFPSLGRAYVMYSGSLCVGAALDWVLTEPLGVHHRIAWVCCLLTTAAISLLFLKRFVFSEKQHDPSPPTAS